MSDFSVLLTCQMIHWVVVSMVVKSQRLIHSVSMGPVGDRPYPEHHFSAGTQGSWNLTNQSLRRTCRNMFQDSVKRAQNSFDLKTSTGVVKIKW